MEYKDKIGFIGLGNMGKPMAKNLEQAGVPLYVYNRTPEKMNDFSEKSIPCNDIYSLVKECDIIFTMLTNDDAVHAVYETILSMDIAGKLFVDMSTISQDASKAISETTKLKGASFIDAPVAGSTQPAKDGTLIFMVGGDEADEKKVLPYLEIMGKEVKYMGANGQGVNAKLCINYYLSILYQGMAETVLFAEKMGISRENMMSIINESASGSGASKVKTSMIIKDEYPAAFSIDLMLKDVKLAVEAGAKYPLTDSVLKTYQGAKDAGFATYDVMSVIPFMEDKKPN
ncbi:NAD(P)-dependent oxidoreductase [Sphingobacterium sp. 1.A.5]|jgi:3-hydroxyisobutyrate dehydrogenase|uniref:NAD(P)-dependent oxidoreductase n=1 Tax=Sphingobacterium sp. 1.A.5 TaxID=2044604 RepID=UPI000C0BDDEC|nr:NAD(P)-dependent oxidoreductase [Sphingobacterium sp. 1.A.5]